jgi:glycosyltransferase involved in cell wall biosynthesis
MEGELPKVSVIVPCYNAKKTIEGCLSGLMDQDYPSYEIIVVDDNSNDGTAELLGAVDGITLIVSKANKGPAYSRNKAVKESTGNLILLIDSDSLVDDDRLIAKHVLAHDGHRSHIIGGGIQGIGKSCVAKADKYSHWFLNIPNSANNVGTHLVTNNMSMRREVFEGIGGFDIKLRTGEDTDFCERALKSGYKLGLRSDAVVKHYDRELLKDFVKNFYLTGIDRIPARRKNKHRYWFLLPFGFLSSLIYCLPLALLLAFQVIHAWFRYDKRVALYFPLIFIGRVAMTMGIVHYCFCNRFLERRK